MILDYHLERSLFDVTIFRPRKKNSTCPCLLVREGSFRLMSELELCSTVCQADAGGTGADL
jgi:hypothetical protein